MSLKIFANYKLGNLSGIPNELLASEIITNSNGTAIKFDNGIMVCFGKKNTGIISFGADGSLAYVARNFSFDNFAVPFISQPTVVKSIESCNPLGRNIYINGTSEPTISNPGTYNLATYWNATSTSCIVTYIAIGKWK